MSKSNRVKGYVVQTDQRENPGSQVRGYDVPVNWGLQHQLEKIDPNQIKSVVFEDEYTGLYRTLNSEGPKAYAVREGVKLQVEDTLNERTEKKELLSAYLFQEIRKQAAEKGLKEGSTPEQIRELIHAEKLANRLHGLLIAEFPKEELSGIGFGLEISPYGNLNIHQQKDYEKRRDFMREVFEIVRKKLRSAYQLESTNIFFEIDNLIPENCTVAISIDYKHPEAVDSIEIYNMRCQDTIELEREE